jgi:hypothetical protein
MFEQALTLLKTKKYMMWAIFFFLFFIFIYFLLDSFNMPYRQMQSEYGLYLVGINVGLNIVMALLTSFMLSLSTINVALKGSETKGSNFGFLSVLFGVLTYGCTTCVITFFASIGIAFSVIALPLAGLPYKFVSLLLILIGLWWTKREVETGVCKIK